MRSRNLGLHGNVKRGGRLVGDQHVGTADHGHGDHDALSHAARKLVWKSIGPGPGIGDAHPDHHGDSGLRGLPAGHRGMNAQHLGNLVADGEHGVQCRHRLLEDHGDAPTAHGIPLRLVKRQEVPSVKADGAAGYAPGRRHQAKQGGGGEGLAAAAFSDQTQGAPRRQIEGHAVDSARHAALAGERYFQVADLEDGLTRHPGAAPYG